MTNVFNIISSKDIESSGNLKNEIKGEIEF